MSSYRYILDNTNKKHLCFGCGKKRFVRYFEIETGEYLPEEYGRCDREVNCGYHLNPYTDQYKKEIYETNPKKYKTNRSQVIPKINTVEVSQIPFEILKRTRSAYNDNSFVHWLKSLFDDEMVYSLISKYHLGTSKHWQGSTVFWQIDAQGKIRTGKIMLYDAFTGKRVKKPINHITWVHKALHIENYNLSQCLFGEHLLKISSDPVALVESEKTAIIGAAYIPGYTWIATGNLQGLKLDLCKPLKRRKVLLFPDLNATNQWRSKALELSSKLKIDFRVSDYLETQATEEDKESGLDIADFLIKFKWTRPGRKQINQNDKYKSVKLNRWGYPASWDKPQTKEEQAIQSMQLKYPILNALIDKFELKAVKKTT